MSNFRDKLFVSKQKGPFDLHYYSNSFKKIRQVFKPSCAKAQIFNAQWQN